MWHAYNVIAKGDQLRASAVRCVVTSQATFLLASSGDLITQAAVLSARVSSRATADDDMYVCSLDASRANRPPGPPRRIGCTSS